jgi:hypothetical protein
VKVVVGSSDLWPTPAIASAILVLMLSTDEHQWAVRANQYGTPSSSVEELTMRIGDRIGKSVVKHYSEPAARSSYKRDNTMTGLANEVFAFFAPGQFMHGGTGHVVSVALRIGIPVTAYELNDEGQVIESATDEGILSQYQGW